MQAARDSFNQTREALTLKFFAQGLIKSAVYGVIVASAILTVVYLQVW